MKRNQKNILKVVKKVIEVNVRKGESYCPVIFHQPKRPEVKNIKR